MANDKANASFHKRYCGGQDGNALYNAIVFMFQDQELCERAVSKDQMLEVYPLYLFPCSFKVCWIISPIQIFVLVRSSFTESYIKSGGVGFLSVC